MVGELPEELLLPGFHHPVPPSLHGCLFPGLAVLSLLPEVAGRLGWLNEVIHRVCPRLHHPAPPSLRGYLSPGRSVLLLLLDVAGRLGWLNEVIHRV